MAEQRSDQRQTPEGQAPPSEASFFHMVQTFAVPALVWTGYLPNPVDSKVSMDLELAKYQIGMLELLERKTKGNLDKDEESFLADMLHNVRLAFVRATEKAKQPPAETAEDEGGKDEG